MTSRPDVALDPDVVIALQAERNGHNGGPPTISDATVQQSPESLLNECVELASTPFILDRFAGEAARQGLVGERTVAQLVYLSATSRLLQRPVSTAIKGESSSGKSNVVKKTLAFFPEEAVYVLTGMSERLLAYDVDTPMRHRMLVIYEAEGMTGDMATYLIRSLLSEGHIKYGTVESTKGGLKPRLLEREGPTGLIVTTTALSLHPENETRLLSLAVDDSQRQTRAIVLAAGDEDEDPLVVPPSWLALQRWIASQDNSTVIPFRREIGKLIPDSALSAVRLRRDINTVHSLIRAHALLHQYNRERDSEGRVVATLDDYMVIRELVNDSISHGIGATIPENVRQTVEAVALLSAGHPDGVSYKALEATLKRSRSTVSRTVTKAIAGGYLRNMETGDKRPARILAGDPLPDDIGVLPPVERLEDCCTVALQKGGRVTA